MFLTYGVLMVWSSVENAKANLMTVPPYAVAVVVLVAFSYASDRLQKFVLSSEQRIFANSPQSRHVYGHS